MRHHAHAPLGRRRHTRAPSGRLYLLLGILFGGAVFASGSGTGGAAGLEQVVLLATDPAEHRAVLRVGDDGELRLLAPGEPIEGTGGIVERVLADRLVVIETAGDPERRRVAWIYLRDRAAGVPHIRYLEGRAPAHGAAAKPPRGAEPEAPPALPEGAGPNDRILRRDG